MRVTHRMLSGNVSRNLYQNLANLQRMSNQLASGKRFDRPSQDPIGTYKAMELKGTSIARNEQFRRNINEAETWLNSSEDSISEAIDVLQRLRELAVYSSNETFSEADRKMVAPEVEELWDHLVSLGNSELAGKFIFSGHKTFTRPYEIAGIEGQMNSSQVNLAAGLKEDGLSAYGIPSGDYAISTEKAMIPGDEIQAQVKEIATFIQGFAPSFLGQENSLQPSATAMTGDIGENNAISYTARTSDDVTISYAENGGEDINITVDENEITITLPDGGATAAQVAEAINSHEEASGLVQARVDMEGNDGGSGIIDTFGDVVENGDWDAKDDLTASIMLEVKDVILNHETETYQLVLNASYHAYDLDGSRYSGERRDLVLDMNKENNVISLDFIKDENGNGDEIKQFSFIMEDAPYPNGFMDDYFTPGDKSLLEITPTLDDAEEYDVISLHSNYGDEDKAATSSWYFNQGALEEEGEDINLHRYFLDEKIGRSFDGMFTLSFEGELQDAPAIPAEMEIYRGSGITNIQHQELPGGYYQVETESNANQGSAVIVGHQYIQEQENGLDSIVVDQEIDADNEVNASLFFEVRDADDDTGEVSLRVISHQYDKEGNYQEFVNNNVVITANGELQGIEIGDLQGFELALADFTDDGVDGEIKEGDKFTLQVRAGDNGAGTDQVTVKGPSLEENPENPAYQFALNSGAWNHKETEIKTFYLDEATGQVYDSAHNFTLRNLTSSDDAASFTVDPAAAQFTFTAAGQLYYQGDDGHRNIEITAHNTVASNVTGFDAFGGTFVFDTAFNMRYALLNNDQFALSGEVLEDLDESLDYLLQRRAEIGARTTRMEATESRLEVEHIHLRSVLSQVEDLDMADAITEYIMQENAYQAALSTGARMIQPSLVDFLR